ncbi:MAG TPA: hypothetical protein VD816_12905 [Ohtaekwangia sp.]|nr:hypothetical protein [Ohtaekwangia sp.]
MSLTQARRPALFGPGYPLQLRPSHMPRASGFPLLSLTRGTQQFTGEYHSRHLDFYCRIVLTDNQLVIRRATIVDKVLIPVEENRFLFEMESGGSRWYVAATFTKDKRGKVDGINLQHVRMMHHRFEKVR